MAEASNGQVVNGVIVLDAGVPSLPEGARVRVEPFAEFAEMEGATPTLAERLRSVIGIAKGLPPDLAEQHDHYIHGTPKR